ncbi:MAG: DUF4239 domain-containing protein [Parachlamydiales bacterium]
MLWDYLESLPWSLGALIMVVGLVLFAIAGVLIVRKTINQKTLRSHHDVAAVVFANVGVLYAVLLGFTVVNVQTRFDKIKETAHLEASYLAELFRDSEVFPEANKIEIRTALRNYGKSVLTDEWVTMNQKNFSILVNQNLHNVWKAYYAIEPKTNREIAWYNQSIDKLNNLMTTRLTRILGSKESLGGEMWSLLLIGGFVLTGFMGFFGLENLTSHIMMASILAAVTAFLLFLIYSLDTPFSGNLTVSTTVYDNVLKLLN